MKVIVAMIAIACCAMVADQASSQTIGIFADPQGTSTDISLTAGVPGQFFILAIMEGEASEGIQGIEFRVTGMPPEWSITSVPHPEASVSWDDPFNDPGPVMVWGDCQTGTGGILVLYTLTVVATNDVPNATLAVIKHELQGIPELQCPVMATCIPPDPVLFCATGGQATIDVTINNDTCAGAIEIPWCSSFSTSGNTMPMTDDYSPAAVDGEGGCTGRTAYGPDEVYRMELVAGLVVHATYTQSNRDGSFYVITDCDEPEDSCVVGADDTGWGEMEIIDWTVETDGTYYLICDTWEWEPQGGPFTLNVTIDCSVPTEKVNWGDLKNMYR